MRQLEPERLHRVFSIFAPAEHAEVEAVDTGGVVVVEPFKELLDLAARGRIHDGPSCYGVEAGNKCLVH